MQLYKLVFGLLVTALPTIAAAEDLIISAEPYTASSKTERNFLDLHFQQTDDMHRVEHGSVNGVFYRLDYTTGRAMFAGTTGQEDRFPDYGASTWAVSCQKDPITDEKTCFMGTRHLVVYVSSKSPPGVVIGSEHFPNSTVTIRIDGGIPITSAEPSVANPSAIITQLKTAKRVVTRFMKWPSKSSVDDDWSIYGFNEVFAYSKWAVAHIK